MSNATNTIAATILRQLGGVGRLSAMIAASSFSDHGDALSFKFKGCRKYNVCKVTLAPDDTYTVELRHFSLRTLKDKNEVSFSGIYADNLKNLIESETGLYLSL